MVNIYIATLYNIQLLYSFTISYSDYNSSTITYGVNIVYQNLGCLLHQKREISKDAICSQTAFIHADVLYFNISLVF